MIEKVELAPIEMPVTVTTSSARITLLNLIKARIDDVDRHTDHFLLDPPDQPKADVSEYVSECGFAIPKRFSSFEEALASSKPFIVRSEHPQDYDGASGILDSPVIDEWMLAEARKLGAVDEIDWDASAENDHFDQSILVLARQLTSPNQAEYEDNLNRLVGAGISEYCEICDISESDFTSNISYSYWEKLDGANCTIVADSTINDRFHIFANGDEEDRYWFGYVMVDRGEIVYAEPALHLSEEFRRSVPSLMESYEAIRVLPKFAVSHCPIIEMQLTDDRNYFLQYLRVRDFEAAEFVLDRDPEDGEIEVDFVRGATPPQGIIVDTFLWYEYEDFSPRNFYLRDEDASFDHQPYVSFSELMTKRRRVQFVDEYGKLDIATKTRNKHLSKSKLFKPPITVVVKLIELIPEHVRESMKGQIEQGGLPSVSLKVISDGQRCFVKYLGRS
jgi:hypothetical protein